MPELPEVETVRRGLEPVLVGHTIERCEILDARLVRASELGAPGDPAHVAALVRGRRVEAVERRGKYLLVVLGDGLVALHHLRMTGSFSVDDDSVTHVRLVYVTDDGRIVRYRDPRRFGTLAVDDRDVVHELLDSRLGPEPLSDAFDATVLRTALRLRQGSLKAALLDQRVVAGLGNIYVDEVCMLAGVRPDAPACDVGPAALGRLARAIKERLTEAIDAGGSTLRDYRGVEGVDGTMQERFVAYGRAGRPCLTCGRTMAGATIAGRSTSFCTRCQRMPRR